MKRRFYIANILRLTAFVGVCIGVLLYADYRAARASVMERLLGIGQRMAPYLDDGQGTEAPRQLRINGVKLFAAAGHTTHPPEFVRKWYSDRYAAKDDGLAQLGAEMRKKGVLPPNAPELNQVVFGDDRQGGMAALDYGDKLSLTALKERLKRFASAGDLGSIAKLRYVYYARTGDGGTRFLTVWTDEKFQLAHLMPAGNQDAEGSDVEGVPRYPGSVRVLSAEERGMPQRLAVYDGPGSAETATMFYKARMKTLGWMEDETFQRLAEKEGRQALKFGNQAGHEVVIDLDGNGATGGITMTVIQTR
jgi:hypothetical protein